PLTHLVTYSEQIADLHRLGGLHVGGVHLRQLQLAADVVVHAVPVGVALEHPDAALAGAVAAGLDPTERHVRLGAVGGVVDRGHAGLDVLLELVRPLAVVGVDGAGEAVLHGVGGLDGLVDAVDLHQVDGGAEDLLLELAHAGLDVLPRRGPAVDAAVRVADEALGLAVVGDAAVAVQQRGAVLLAPLVLLQPALVEALVDEGAVQHVLGLQGVADADPIDGLEEARLELVVDRRVDDDVAGAGATLPAGAEGAEDGALHSVVEIGIAHDHQRVLAAQLEGGVLQVAARHLADVAANLARAG